MVLQRCFIPPNITRLFWTFLMALRREYVHHYKNNTLFVWKHMYMYSAYGFLYRSKHMRWKGEWLLPFISFTFLPLHIYVAGKTFTALVLSRYKTIRKIECSKTFLIYIYSLGFKVCAVKATGYKLYPILHHSDCMLAAFKAQNGTYFTLAARSKSHFLHTAFGKHFQW